MKEYYANYHNILVPKSDVIEIFENFYWEAVLETFLRGEDEIIVLRHDNI
jgi:hypothetical protein